MCTVLDRWPQLCIRFDPASDQQQRREVLSLLVGWQVCDTDYIIGDDSIDVIGDLCLFSADELLEFPAVAAVFSPYESRLADGM